MGILSSIIGGGISSALSLGSKYLEKKFISDPQAEDAWDRTYGAYKSRYQDTMADMKAAGLNPILAAASGGFNVGSGPQAQLAHLPQGQDVAANAKSFAEAGLAEEKATTEKVEQMKKLAEVKSELARKFKIRAETGKASEEERRVWFEIERLHSETILAMKKGFQSEAEKELIRAKIKQLNVELTRLKNVNTIYANPASMALSLIRELANSLGLNIGVVMKGGK